MGKELKFFKLWLVLGILWTGASSYAQSDEDLLEENSSSNEAREQKVKERKTLASRVPAVSGHRFLKAKRFELSPTFSMSTNDAFYRRVAAGARAAYHFNEFLSLDLGLASVLSDQDLQSVRSTDPDFLSSDGVIDENQTDMLFDIGVGFSPIYGKMSLGAEAVLHFDLYATAGLGVNIQSTHPCAQFWPSGSLPEGTCDRNNPAGSSAATSGTSLGFNFGFGGRFIINRFFALRAELRNTVYSLEGVNTNSTKTLRMLGLGASFFFPMKFDVEHTYQAIED